MKRVVIVGGGIAGLTLAYRLEQARCRVTLIDRRPRLGGVIETARRDGFLIEGGPDSFITMKPWARDLCRELGLEDELIPTQTRNFFVYSGGRLHKFPPGMLLTVPTKIWPVLETRLLSLAGKFRMGLDLVLPRGGGGDESIGSFIRRRLGREALEKIAEPLMAGIYMAPADRLSLQTTFPRFAEIERKHGSLIRAMRNVKASGASPFLALRGGMSGLVDALRSRLKKTTILTGRNVELIAPRYKVYLDNAMLQADILVLAVPAPDAARLLRSFADDLADEIGKIPSSNSATVSVGFPASAVTKPLNGTGFVIPRRQRRRVLACTWASQKFAGRAPDGHVLFRCFFGGTEDPDTPGESDQALIGHAVAELRLVLGIKGDPVVSKVFRWPEANPVYEVGHQERVKKIDGMRPKNLYLTGCAYRGIGLPDGIHEANETAETIKRSAL